MKTSSLIALAIFSILWSLTVTAAAQTPKAGSATLRPIKSIHSALLSKFTPVDQPINDVGINHTGEEVFTGDCDDYYTAAFNQLYVHGYDPFAYILAVKGTGQPHIVACTETSKGLRCLDHNRKRVSSVRDLRQWYRLIETRGVSND